MRKILFYTMEEKKMCFMHVLMNALQLHENGYEVKIVFEGQAVKWPSTMEKEKNPLYFKAKEGGILAGICQACARMLEVHDESVETGLPMLADMNGHAGLKPFVDAGYEIVM